MFLGNCEKEIKYNNFCKAASYYIGILGTTI